LDQSRFWQLQEDFVSVEELIWLVINFKTKRKWRIKKKLFCYSSRTTLLHTFGDRLEFVAKYAILGVAWVLGAIFAVIIFRGKTGAVNPLSG
jgi:hypothetical protein